MSAVFKQYGRIQNSMNISKFLLLFSHKNIPRILLSIYIQQNCNFLESYLTHSVKSDLTCVLFLKHTTKLKVYLSRLAA